MGNVNADYSDLEVKSHTSNDHASLFSRWNCFAYKTTQDHSLHFLSVKPIFLIEDTPTPSPEPLLHTCVSIILHPRPYVA